MFGKPSRLEQVSQQVNDVFAGHVMLNFQAEILPSEFIDDHKPLKRTDADNAIEDKIPAPNIVDTFGLPTISRIGTVAKPTLFMLFLFFYALRPS